MLKHGSFSYMQQLEILPLHCQQYLKSKNWKMVEFIDDIANVWENSSKEYQAIQILLPLDTGLGDYKRRMAEFIETLEVAEGRSRESIIADLQGLSIDKLRIALNHPKGGCVGLVNAAKVIDRSLDMLAAAANSVIEPKPFYRSRYPKQVQQYIDGLELGHTEHGSFVFKIHSPVTPALINDDNTENEKEAPFARRVMCQLVEILKKSIMVANHGDTQHFKDAVKHGISSNFCEALADVVAGADSSEVSFNFSWSPTRPCSLNTDSIIIRRDIAEVLQEAGHFLRTNVSEEGAEIVGYVVGLDKDRLQTEGEVKIVDVTDGLERTVYLKLQAEQYQEAITAHSQGNRVVALGNIEKKHNKSVMTNVLKFAAQQI
jgi:hypothetical protein